MWTHESRSKPGGRWRKAIRGMSTSNGGLSALLLPRQAQAGRPRRTDLRAARHAALRIRMAHAANEGIWIPGICHKSGPAYGRPSKLASAVACRTRRRLAMSLWAINTINTRLRTLKNGIYLQWHRRHDTIYIFANLLHNRSALPVR